MEEKGAENEEIVYAQVEDLTDEDEEYQSESEEYEGDEEDNQEELDIREKIANLNTPDLVSADTVIRIIK